MNGNQYGQYLAALNIETKGTVVLRLNDGRRMESSIRNTYVHIKSTCTYNQRIVAELIFSPVRLFGLQCYEHVVFASKRSQSTNFGILPRDSVCSLFRPCYRAC